MNTSEASLQTITYASPRWWQCLLARPSDGRLFARLLLAAAMTLATGQLARAETAVRPIRVALAPTVRGALSGIAWRALTQECGDIWAREGIALTWAGADAGAHVVLPLVFDDREIGKHDPKGEDALGVTVFEGRSLRILVSVARARRVNELRRGFADSRDSTTLDFALGVLLGRVIAHEVGHALLLTTRHSTDGLMRAQYGATDVRPDMGGQFALSLRERDRLAVRFSNLPAPVQLAEAAPVAAADGPRAVAASRGTALADLTWTDVPPAPVRLRAPR